VIRVGRRAERGEAQGGEARPAVSASAALVARPGRRRRAIAALACTAARFARPGRRLRAIVALACTAALFAAPASAQAPDLFTSTCSACHGTRGQGVPGKGPDLRDAGAAAADFYLNTGRMPLSHPDVPPQRTRPEYSANVRRQLIAYIASLGDGPAVPPVDPAKGDLQQGYAAFTDHCAGCHTITARGGVAPPGAAPALQQANATQIAEAVRVGPYLMPKFGANEIDQHELDSITRYVLSTHHLDNAGGWSIGNIGPIPEGLVAWLLAGSVLLLVTRLIGERR
jgi:ubiquinol-cytochrome c reductase cytochrome c subunit